MLVCHAPHTLLLVGYTQGVLGSPRGPRAVIRRHAPAVYPGVGRPRGAPAQPIGLEYRLGLRLAVRTARVALYHRRVRSARVDHDLIGRDRRSEFSRRAWEQCAEIGIQGLFLPEEYGGGAADPLTTVYVLEGLGYGCQDNGLLFSLNAHMWACEIPIWKFAGPEQRATICRGSPTAPGSARTP